MSEKQLQCGKEEGYLAKLFIMLKKREELVFESKDAHFNNTEIRLIREVAMESARGGRLISTQLAKRLGVTRSAVSQIVNHLEARGVVKRVAAETDKKIAYIELSESVMEQYSEDINGLLGLVGKIVEEFGEEKFEKMFALYDEFTDLAKSYIDRTR